MVFIIDHDITSDWLIGGQHVKLILASFITSLNTLYHRYTKLIHPKKNLFIKIYSFAISKKL